MSTLGNSVDKYVTGRMFQSSNDRRWPHLLAEIWSHEAGELPPQLPRDTEIAIQLRGHSLVDRRGAGMHQRTLSKKGTVWLCPAGISEDYINIVNPMQECLHIFVPGKPFDETVLKDLDIDPSNISIQYSAIDRDVFIEYVADQILKELETETSTGRLLIESLTNALSAHLVHTYSATAVRLKPSCAADKPLDLKRLKRVTEFIQASIERAFTVDELASGGVHEPGAFFTQLQGGHRVGAA